MPGPQKFEVKKTAWLRGGGWCMLHSLIYICVRVHNSGHNQFNVMEYVMDFIQDFDNVTQFGGFVVRTIRDLFGDHVEGLGYSHLLMPDDMRFANLETAEMHLITNKVESSPKYKRSLFVLPGACNGVATLSRPRVFRAANTLF